MISLNKLKILWLIAMLLTTVGSVSFAQQNPFYYPNTPEFEEYPLVINRKYNANITGYWEKFYGLGKLKECGEQLVYKNAESYYSNWLTTLRNQAKIEIHYDKLP